MPMQVGVDTSPPDTAMPQPRRWPGPCSPDRTRGCAVRDSCDGREKALQDEGRKVMADGTTYKRCSCTGADDKALGQKCPQLRLRGPINHPARSSHMPVFLQDASKSITSNTAIEAESMPGSESGRSDSARTSPPPMSTDSGVPTPQQITMPTQNRVRADQQREAPQRVHRQTMQQPREEEPIVPSERRPLQHAQLMPAHQDLDVLVVIACGQQPREREGGRHHEIGQAQQHDRSSCRYLARRSRYSPERTNRPPCL